MEERSQNVQFALCPGRTARTRIRLGRGTGCCTFLSMTKAPRRNFCQVLTLRRATPTWNANVLRTHTCRYCRIVVSSAPCATIGPLLFVLRRDVEMACCSSVGSPRSTFSPVTRQRAIWIRSRVRSCTRLNLTSSRRYCDPATQRLFDVTLGGIAGKQDD